MPTDGHALFFVIFFPIMEKPKHFVPIGQTEFARN